MNDTMNYFDNDSATMLFEHLSVEIHIWQIVRDSSNMIKTWKLVYANPPALKTWGFDSLAAVKDKTTDEIFGDGATEHYLPVVKTIIEDKKPYTFKDYFPNLKKHFRFTSVPYGEMFITTGDDITEFIEQQETLKEENLDLEKLIKERNEKLKLQEEQIHLLHDIIPICSYCRNIRDEEGAWDRLEEYISKNSHIQFSHGICPDCLKDFRKSEGLDKNTSE